VSGVVIVIFRAIHTSIAYQIEEELSCCGCEGILIGYYIDVMIVDSHDSCNVE
jgi:hypothetical protein